MNPMMLNASGKQKILRLAEEAFTSDYLQEIRRHGSSEELTPIDH
jgi:hypothetical protein